MRREQGPPAPGSSRRSMTVLEGRGSTTSATGATLASAMAPVHKPRGLTRRRAHRMKREPLRMIDVRDVSRLYHRGVDLVHALERVSLHVPAGRFVALMGPSGSGKSTLLHLVAGLDRPDSGEVVVAGRALSGLDEGGLAAWGARRGRAARLPRPSRRADLPVLQPVAGADRGRERRAAAAPDRPRARRAARAGAGRAGRRRAGASRRA